MKKILIVIMLLCVCGCSNMQTVTVEDVADEKVNLEEKIQETMKELDSYIFTNTKVNTQVRRIGYLCNENGEQIIDLYLNPDKNGKINIKIYYDIQADTISSVEGLFFAMVDEKIVPSSILGGKEMDMHCVSIPTNESMSDVSVNLKDIDLSFNHMITFYIIDATNEDGVINRITKYIGTEDNKSYMEYMEKLPYTQETNDAFMKKEIEAKNSQNFEALGENLYNYKYQTVFMGGDIFPLTADENILRQADQEGRELTKEESDKFNFKYEKGKNLEFEVLYKARPNTGHPTSGLILVWCNGEWATFDGKQSLIYNQSENGLLKGKGSIQIPNEPGKYELWYLNINLNDATGSRFLPFARKHIVEIK